MAARVGELDEVTFDLEVDGEEVRRTVGRRVMEARGWATVVVAFQERRPPADWGAAKLAIVRLRKARGGWTVMARMTMGGEDALVVADALEEWRAVLTDLEGGDEDGDEDEDEDGDDGDEVDA